MSPGETNTALMPGKHTKCRSEMGKRFGTRLQTASANNSKAIFLQSNEI